MDRIAISLSSTRLTLATVAASMSEYQYDEFQAIDRPLGAAEQEALRALSTRARPPAVLPALAERGRGGRVRAGRTGADARNRPDDRRPGSFADFFHIDRDIVAAAAERSAYPLAGQPASSKAVRPIIAAMTDREETDLLARLFDGDAHVASELRAFLHQRLGSEIDAPLVAARTVGELRTRAEAIRIDRERAQAEKAATEQRRRDEEAERVRRARLDAIRRRGESICQEIEAEIERRGATGYDKAASLLLDLRAISEEDGAPENFVRRLRIIRECHV